MEKGTMTRNLIAGSIAAAGLTLGGIGLAGAADDDSPDNAGHHAAMAADLADALGVSEDKVESALEKLHENRQAKGREALSDRLDAAVDDGTLTEADKASVLKAYDADLIGGGHGGPGRGPGPR